MRKGLIILLILFSAGFSAWAQSFSVEVGTGLPSLFTQFPTLDKEGVFSARGQKAKYKWTPTADVSVVWLATSRWEFALSCGYAQRLYEVTQYQEFGIDPYGQTRYDYSRPGQPLGTKGLKPVETLFFQGRYVWNLVLDGIDSVIYSSLGAGIMTDLDDAVIPVMGITPFAFRISGTHFYFFAEATLSPLATFAHGGFGWRF